MEAGTFQVQIKAWKTRHVGERVSRDVARPGVGWTETWGWKVGWGRVVWGLECQAEKNKQGHLEHSLRNGAKVSKLAVGPWEEKDRKESDASREEGIGLSYFQNMLKWLGNCQSCLVRLKAHLCHPYLMPFSLYSAFLGLGQPREPIRDHIQSLRNMNNLIHFKETQNCLSHCRLSPEDLKDFKGKSMAASLIEH